MNALQRIRNNVWYDRTYNLTVLIKGFDGMIELLAGVWILLWPASLHGFLEYLYTIELGWHSALGRWAAGNTSRTDHELYGSTLALVVLFLISHGVIKLALVYALIKRILWAYPYAIGALVLFLIAQVSVLIKHPTLGMAFLTFLDVAIIWIVWGEWQKLKFELAHKKKVQ